MSGCAQAWGRFPQMRCLMRNWWINHRIFRQYPWVFIQLTFTFPSAVGQNTSILLFTWACSKSSCFLWIFIPHKNMVIPSFRPPKSHIFPKKSPKNHLQSLPKMSDISNTICQVAVSSRMWWAPGDHFAIHQRREGAMAADHRPHGHRGQRGNRGR